VTAMLVLILLLNYGISWLNAYSVSKMWLDAKAAGFWAQLMCWCGAIMAASGFSWCYVILVLYGVEQFGYIDKEAMVIGLKLGYLVLAPSILGTGLFITIDSWLKAYRDRSFLSVGTAAWNTYAQISNTIDAFQNYGGFLKDVGEAFGSLTGGSSSDDDDDSKSLNPRVVILLICIVVSACLAGIIQTYLIIRAGIASQAREIAYQKRLVAGPKSS
jgi:hypothetical protein